MPIAADQRHPNALKPKKPRKPPGLAGLSLANLAPENSFVLSDTGTFQKGGFRINAAGVQDCPAKKVGTHAAHASSRTRTRARTPEHARSHMLAEHSSGLLLTAGTHVAPSQGDRLPPRSYPHSTPRPSTTRRLATTRNTEEITAGTNRAPRPSRPHRRNTCSPAPTSQQSSALHRRTKACTAPLPPSSPQHATRHVDLPGCAVG